MLIFGPVESFSVRSRVSGARENYGERSRE